MIVCVAEDRDSYEAALQLLILSLAKHSPQLRVFLFYPVVTEAFIRWLDQHPQVSLSTERFSEGGWSIKPQAFLRLFELGYEDVLWVDSDIIITRDIVQSLGKLDERVICITEESLWGKYRDWESPLWCRYGDSGALRVAFWNDLKPGRALPHMLNAAVVRATVAHRALLIRWHRMLQSEAYREAQRKDFLSRPLAVASDQDVLTALLASSEFSDIPMRVLARGRDIIQFMGLHGYPLVDRLTNMMFGMPMFIHAQAQKPWVIFRPGAEVTGLGAYVRAVYADTSPYTLSAMRFREQLKGELRWMDAHFMLSKLLRTLGLWYPPLVALPIACVAGLFAAGKALARRVGMRRNRTSG